MSQLNGLPSTAVCACLDNIRSAYNVGAIFRSAEAHAIQALYLTGFTPLPLSPKLQKTALGSLSAVPWLHYCDCSGALTALRQAGFQIVVCEINAGGKLLTHFKFLKPTCFVFGHEVTGVQPAILKAADIVLEIPQYGQKESLNVANAAGIFFYEFRRQHPL